MKRLFNKRVRGLINHYGKRHTNSCVNLVKSGGYYHSKPMVTKAALKKHFYQQVLNGLCPKFAKYRTLRHFEKQLSFNHTLKGSPAL